MHMFESTYVSINQFAFYFMYHTKKNFLRMFHVQLRVFWYVVLKYELKVDKLFFKKLIFKILT